MKQTKNVTILLIIPEVKIYLIFFSFARNIASVILKYKAEKKMRSSKILIQIPLYVAIYQGQSHTIS